jgi:sortase A
VEAIRQHARVRRLTRIVSVAMITAGVVILTDAAMTLAWKEPVSLIYGAVKQAQASDELAGLQDEFGATADLDAVANAGGLEPQAQELARQFAREAPNGEGIGRIKIPSIGIDYVFVEGTGTTTLQRGLGRYPETAFPGQGKTIGIAGHRTTYLAPFRKINDVDDTGTSAWSSPPAIPCSAPRSATCSSPTLWRSS